MSFARCLAPGCYSIPLIPRSLRMRRSRMAPLLLPLLAIVVSGCRSAENELRPDVLLRDSLGLGEDDRVHRVGLGSDDNRERVEPVQVTVRPGDYVEFVTQDRRVHAVAFLLDSLTAPAAAFLRDSGQEGSPPMVDAGTRFVVSFARAPLGVYPFVVTGNGEPGRGTVVVAGDDSQG